MTPEERMTKCRKAIEMDPQRKSILSRMKSIFENRDEGIDNSLIFSISANILRRREDEIRKQFEVSMAAHGDKGDLLSIGGGMERCARSVFFAKAVEELRHGRNPLEVIDWLCSVAEEQQSTLEKWVKHGTGSQIVVPFDSLPDELREKISRKEQNKPT